MAELQKQNSGLNSRYKRILRSMVMTNFIENFTGSNKEEESNEEVFKLVGYGG